MEYNQVSLRHSAVKNLPATGTENPSDRGLDLSIEVYVSHRRERPEADSRAGAEPAFPTCPVSADRCHMSRVNALCLSGIGLS